MHRRISTTLSPQTRPGRPARRRLHPRRLPSRRTHLVRELPLTPAAIIHWFLIQVLHGNTALTHVSLMAGRAFSASAFCQARARLPLAVFHAVLREMVQVLVPATEAVGRWLGHRAFLIDGSSFSMPDTPVLQAHFGQPSNQAKGCGFPVAHILALFHAGTGLLLEVAAAPLRSHDMSGILGILPLLKAGDVLVADRGFCSFAHLAMLMARVCMPCFACTRSRSSTSRPAGRTPGPARSGASRGCRGAAGFGLCGLMDQVVEYFKPAEVRGGSVPRPTGVAGVVRGARIAVSDRGAGVPDSGGDAGDDADRRRGVPGRGAGGTLCDEMAVEEHLKSLKMTMKMDVLKCKTVEGVLKELTMYAIAYNLVRLTMVQAGGRQGVEADRVSFIDALRWLRGAEEGEEMPELVVNPLRPGRYEPRVRKRRPKQYPLMRKPRAELRKMLREKDLAA